MAYVSILGQTGGKPLKYATGTFEVPSGSGDHTASVSGLGFKPYAIGIVASGANYSCGFGICNADGTVVNSKTNNLDGVYLAPASFASSADGFSIAIRKLTYGAQTFTYYAIGQ